MAYRLGSLRGPTLASCVLVLTQTSCYKFQEEEEEPPPNEGYAWSEENGDFGSDDESETSNGSLRLHFDKDIPGLHKEDKIRLEVNSLCKDEGRHEEFVPVPAGEPVAVESTSDADGGLALHKKRRHRHRHPGHPPHELGQDVYFCVGPQFMDLYSFEEIADTIEVNGLVPGPAEVVVTIVSPFGPGLIGSSIVDIVAGETSPADVKLHPFEHGPVAIDWDYDYEEETPEVHVPREGAEVLAWERATLTVHESVKSACTQDSFVAYNKVYEVWVGALTCSDDRYKLVMSDKKDGVFHEIVDFSGHGQDHCELVNPKFELPDDDDINSVCVNCATGEMKDPIGTPAYARAYVGESFTVVDKTGEWGDLTSEWYECGIAIK